MLKEKASTIADFIGAIEDAGLTPHVVILNGAKVLIPSHLAGEPQISFNVSSVATGHRFIDEDGFSFKARFGGKEFQVYFPIDNIVGVVSKCGTMQLEMAELNVPSPKKPIVSYGANWYNFIGARGEAREEVQKSMVVEKWPSLLDRTPEEKALAIAAEMKRRSRLSYEEQEELDQIDWELEEYGIAMEVLPVDINVDPNTLGSETVKEWRRRLAEEGFKLSVLKGDGQGDSVPKGKLTLIHPAPTSLQ